MIENLRGIGSATVRETFELSSRGIVLIFEPNHHESIPQNGLVRCYMQWFDFFGPELVDASSARSYASIVVSDRDILRFVKPGVVVIFAKRQNAK